MVCLCQKCFKKEVKYWTHIVRVHPPPPDSESDTDPSLYCADCKFTFPTQASFDRHMAVVHQTGTIPFDQLKIVQDEISPTVNEFNYCTRCQFTFIRKNDFFIHLVRVHGIDMELDPYPIKMHHPVLVPDFDHPHHFCNACEYTFRNKNNFWQHLLKQHEIPGLQQQQDVVEENVVHVKAHTREPDVNDADNYCLACDKRYCDVFSYRRHLKVVHHIEYDKPKVVDNSNVSKRCETCRITLTSPMSYRRHLKSQRHGLISASLKVQTGKVNQQKGKVIVAASKRNEKKLKDTVAQLLQQLEQKKTPRNGIVSNLLKRLQQHQESGAEQEESGEQEESDGDDENETEDSMEQHQPYVPIEQHLSPKQFLVRNLYVQPDVNNTDNFCTACEYTFSKRDKLRNHLVKVHMIPETQLPPLTQRKKETTYVTLSTTEELNNVSVRCLKCNGAYKTAALYNEHLETEHTEAVTLPAYVDLHDPMSRCTACNRAYSSMHSYRSHLETVHCIKVISLKSIRKDTPVEPDINDPGNRCCVCRRTFASRLNYYKHLKCIHKITLPNIDQYVYNGKTPDTKDPNHYCAACEKSFAKRRSYVAHLHKIHGVPHSSLVNHVKYDGEPDINNPNNTCTACERTYPNVRRFKDHLVRVHWKYLQKTKTSRAVTASAIVGSSGGSVVPDMHETENRCNICDRQYHSKRNFRVHLMDEHGLRVPEAEQPETEDNLPKRKIRTSNPDGRKTYTCDTCQDTFKSGRDCRYHKVRAHDAKPQKLFLPAWINLKEVPDFNGPTNTCTACKRKYSSFKSLRTHLVNIHNMKLPKTASKPRLLIHQKSGGAEPDVNDTRNWCAACDKVYSSKYSYRNHLRFRHRMDLPTYSVKTDPDLKDVNKARSPPVVKKVTHGATRSRVSSGVVKNSCSECDTTYFSKRELSIHIKFSHGAEKRVNSKRVLERINYNENIPDINDAGNWCKVCDKVFGNRGKYQSHLSRAHHVYSVIKEEGSSQDELASESMAVAEKSSKRRKISIPRKRTVKKQKTGVKGTTEMKILQCEECNEQFQDNLLYQIHLVEGHNDKRLVNKHKKKKKVQWDLPQDDDE
ncbi:hypothetical protein HPULCUR_007395 [Helicostylum pulchrum]|uniref:C2H2-type domain-containing protein n=1 Tax=Helicostylum pulchrum TaxID=562976 RepID=A0ABP9Y6H6_9FUNG